MHDIIGATGYSIQLLPCRQIGIKNIDKPFIGIINTCIQINIQHRIRFPFRFQPCDGKPFEQILLAFEVGFQRRKEEAFSKTAWAG